MRLPTFRRIVYNDFEKEAQPMVEKLASSLNHGIEVLYDVLNRKVNLSDNVACQVADLQIQVDSDGIPTTLTTFKIANNNIVMGLQVIQVNNLTNSTTYPTNAPFCSFTQNNNIVTIEHITGLQINNLYQVKIVAYYF